MINFDDVTKAKIKEHNPNCSQIPNHPCRILIIGASGSGKANSLFNLISHQPDRRYEQSTGLKHLNDSKAFIEYSNDMDDIHKNIEKYNPNKKRKILIIFDDMIADMLSKKKLM